MDGQSRGREGWREGGRHVVSFGFEGRPSMSRWSMIVFAPMLASTSRAVARTNASSASLLLVVCGFVAYARALRETSCTLTIK